MLTALTFKVPFGSGTKIHRLNIVFSALTDTKCTNFHHISSFQAQKMPQEQVLRMLRSILSPVRALPSPWSTSGFQSSRIVNFLQWTRTDRPYSRMMGVPIKFSASWLTCTAYLWNYFTATDTKPFQYVLLTFMLLYRFLYSSTPL